VHHELHQLAAALALALISGAHRTLLLLCTETSVMEFRCQMLASDESQKYRACGRDPRAA
jgi:hypothetical protein